MCGNALDIETLREARAGAAKFGLMMTANAEINAIAARQLHEMFQIPTLAVVRQAYDASANFERLRSLEVATLFGTAISMTDWDHWFSLGVVRIERIKVSELHQPIPVFEKRRLLLAVENAAGEVSPFISITPYHVGDTLLVATFDGDKTT